MRQSPAERPEAGSQDGRLWSNLWPGLVAGMFVEPVMLHSFDKLRRDPFGTGSGSCDQSHPAVLQCDDDDARRMKL